MVRIVRIPKIFTNVEIPYHDKDIVDCENWSTSCGDTSWMKFVTIKLSLKENKRNISVIENIFA